MTATEIDFDRGLTGQQVSERVVAGKINAVPAVPTRTVKRIVVGNVLTPVNFIVAVLAALVIAAGSPRDALFAGVIVANSVIGIVQELRAKNTLDKLSVVTAPKARVVRDGTVTEIAVNQLVLDDVIELRGGAQVVADGTVLSRDNLEIDESLLTGEADSIAKNVGDEVLSGSAVVAGTGRAVITKVGADNYASKLAEEAKRFTLVNSPLRNDVNRIVTWVGWAMIPVGLLLASSQFLRLDQGWRQAIVKTASGLIGMVPEGLVLMTSVAFAVGVVRLAKRRCLVQELPAIEVLARVDVLCADKTGTITEGILAVTAIHAIGDTDEETVSAALAAMANNDPDPNATLVAVRTAYPTSPGWKTDGRVPFSSGRKWSAMSFTDHGSWVLGAPENVLQDGFAGELRQQVDEYAAEGTRVLVLAHTDTAMADGTETLPPITAAGLVLLEDIVRSDAAETLQFFTDQGVTIKVISGDNPVTVSAVARRAGLETWESFVNADTLPAEDDMDALADAVEATSIFGRVTPHQKRSMVKALQYRGHTVAMTGDGVNDVLALKDADCGIAMASGSEATRGVAQLVLLDSNFSALPAVVAEGRRVINNIERVASLFLTKTIYSLVLSVLTGVFAVTYPLLPRHLTILSWLTIGIPAFFLALEPNTERVRDGFLRRVLGVAIPAGLVIALLTMGVFTILQSSHSIDPRSTWTLVDSVLTNPHTEASGIAVLVAGSIALMNLYRVARPMNLLRMILVATMAGLMALIFVIPAGRDYFELPLTRPWAYGLAAIFIGAGYPLLQLGQRLSDNLWTRFHPVRLKLARPRSVENAVKPGP